jgi:heptosyltransferase III
MNPPRTVLVVVTRRIGDVLLATPVIRSLRSKWPDAAIDALVFAGTDGILAGNPDIRSVIKIAERLTLQQHRALAKQLWRSYDLALSLIPGDRPTLYAWMAGRASIGLIIDSPKHYWKRLLLGRWVPFENADAHTVQSYLRILTALGVAPRHEVVANWTDRDGISANAKLNEAGIAGDFVVMHPSPRFAYKTWTAAGWRDVGQWLMAEGYRVVLTGGPDALERDYVASIAASLPGAVNLAGKLSLAETGYILSRARLYIGPDTAVTHLAAAVNTPVVALFGPTDPVKWGPWPATSKDGSHAWQRIGSQRAGNVSLVQGTGTCVPCMNEGCQRHIESLSDCLQQLPASRVIEAAGEMLKGGARG